jgi:hypothetical protein
MWQNDRIRKGAMVSRMLRLLLGLVLLEASPAAQCKPGYAASGSPLSSSCSQPVVPSAPLPGPVLGSDVFYSDPRIYPVPPVFGPLSSHPGVALLPPALPSWYFQPLYFPPPTPWVGPGSSLYSPPAEGSPPGIRPEGTYGYPSPRGLDTPIADPGRTTLGIDGVWMIQ